MTPLAQPYTLHMAGKSDVGQVRKHNEDAIAWNAVLGLAILADGMGGHRAGDVASRLAVDTLQSVLASALAKPPAGRAAGGESAYADLVRRAISKANAVVFAAGHGEAGCHGMGTTLVMALFHAHGLVVAHAGDSRMYRLRGGLLHALTQDHSLVEQLVDRGVMNREQAGAYRYKNVITNAVGVHKQITPSILEVDVQVGDVYLLCSDGLSNVVKDVEIARALALCKGDGGNTATQLVRLANRRGGPDNVSVVVVRVVAPV